MVPRDSIDLFRDNFEIDIGFLIGKTDSVYGKD